MRLRDIKSDLSIEREEEDIIDLEEGDAGEGIEKPCGDASNPELLLGH